LAALETKAKGNPCPRIEILATDLPHLPSEMTQLYAAKVWCKVLEIEGVYSSSRPTWMDGGTKEREKAGSVKEEIKQKNSNARRAPFGYQHPRHRNRHIRA
jgi:hypothetical protein